MTVTIGAICGTGNSLLAGSIMLCADTLVVHMVEGVPITSNEAGAKLFDLPLGFYGALSDDISTGVQIRSYLYEAMAGISPDDPRRIDLIEAALQCTGEYARKWMRQEVLGRHNVTLDEFLHEHLKNRREIEDEIKAELLPVQLIIGGFTSRGCPILLFTDCTHVQRETNPGFFCGGAGGWAARDWLNMREQNSRMSIQRTAYHIHEAKRFAQVSPVVGKRHEVILLRHNKPMVSIGGDRKILSDWMSEHMPKPTNELDSPQAWADFAGMYGISPSTNSSADQT